MHLRPSVLFTLGLLAALTPFAIDLYLPAIPAIARDLGSSVEAAQLSLAVYLGVFSLAQLLLGPLSDVLGRRATILGGLLFFTLASLLCMAAPSMNWLLAARALQALGGGAVAVTIPALVRDLAGRDEYARTMSLIMLVMAIAPLVAPTLGGAIVAVASWPWLFLLLALIALVAATQFHLRIGETLHPEHRHVFHPLTVLRNYRQILGHAVGMGYLLTGGLAFGGMMAFIVGSPFVYIERYQVPAHAYGLLFGLNVLGAVACASFNARYVCRLGSERLLRLGLGVQFAATLLLAALALLPQQPPLWLLVAAAVLYVAMNGFVLGNSMAGYMAFFARLAGTASAFAGAIRFGLGAVTGVAVSLLHDGSATPMLAVMAGCGVLTVVAYGMLCRPAAHEG
jgi:MFS transporter, DHA1 family, multidrug resistance protein